MTSAPDGCTNDAVYNLKFATSYRVCFKDGERHGLFEYDHYYVTVQMVDLGVASITVLDGGGLPISKSDTGPYYSVLGDEKTRVSNGTVEWNIFNTQRPGNYRNYRERGCLDGQGFIW